MPAKLPFHDSPPHLREFTAFLDALNKESARGAVLVAAAMLDDLLERSIKAFLVDDAKVESLMEGFNAPLGNLSARALAAFALGVLSVKEYQECERLRKIRNVFAHNVHSSFADQKLKDLCANLEFAAKGAPGAPLDAKGQYTTAAVALIVGLTNRPHYATQRRLIYKEWPY